MNSSILAERLTADLPKITSFLNLKQVELAEITKSDPAWWNRVLQGAGMNEASLRKMAKKLQMEPHSLLFAIELRREDVNLQTSDVALISK